MKNMMKKNGSMKMKIKNTDDKKQNTHFKARRTIFLILAILLIGVFFSNFVSSFDWDTGLKAYYDLEDNQDSSPNAKHLTSGTGIYTAGLIGNCLNNSYIYGQFADFGINASSDKSFSISLWVNKYSTGSQNILGFDDTLANLNYGATAQYALTHAGGGTRWQSAVNDWKNATNILDNPPIGWRHLVAVKNSTNLMFYVNGTLKQTIKISSWNSGLTREFLIGADNITGNVVWKGKIDEVGVWQRELTPADITFLYNGGVGVGFDSSNVPTITLINPSNGSSLSTIGTNFTANFNTTLLNYVWKNATFYVYNTTGLFNKTTISLSGNHTQGEQFIDSFVLGDYHWNVLGCYGNTTFSNCTFATSNFTYFVGINIIDVSYETSVLGGAVSQFSINLSYASELLTSSGITVLLNYNNTNYTTTKSGITNLKFSTSIITPNVAIETLKQFKFIVLLDTGGITQFVSESYNQTLSPFLIDNCAVYTKVLMSMTIKDEERLTGINGTIEVLVNIYASGTSDVILTYNRSYNYVTPIPSRVCINNATGTYDLSYQILYYSNSSYFKKYKTIQKLEITPSIYTQNIILYDLLKSSGETFNVFVVGNLINTNGNSDLLVDTQRQYISQNQFYSIESSVTNSEGIAITHLVESDQVYNFIVSYNGVVLGTFNNYRVKCQNEQTGQCSITLNLARATGLLDSFEDYGNISQVFLLDSVTNILYQTFSSTNGEFHIINSLVIKADGYGNTIICNNTATGTSGTIQCSIPIIYQDTGFFVETSVDGVYIGSKYFSQGVDPNWYGVDIFIELLMVSSIVLLFISHPIAIIFGAILGLVSPILLLYVTGVSFNAIMGATIFYIVAGIAAVIVIGRKR